MASADRPVGRPLSAGRRRPLRHERGVPEKRHSDGVRQRDSDQGKPDRNPDRDHRDDPHGPAGGVCHHRVAPLGRDGRHDHRRSGRSAGDGTDQDRFALPHRPDSEVQPAAAHRGAAGRQRRLPRHGGFPCEALTRNHRKGADVK